MIMMSSLIWRLSKPQALENLPIQWSTEQKICSAGSLLVFDIALLHSRPVHCCCHCWVGKSPNPMPINHQSMLPVCGESKLLIS